MRENRITELQVQRLTPCPNPTTRQFCSILFFFLRMIFISHAFSMPFSLPSSPSPFPHFLFLFFLFPHLFRFLNFFSFYFIDFDTVRRISPRIFPSPLHFKCPPFLFVITLLYWFTLHMSTLTLCFLQDITLALRFYLRLRIHCTIYIAPRACFQGLETWPKSEISRTF